MIMQDIDKAVHVYGLRTIFARRAAGCAPDHLAHPTVLTEAVHTLCFNPLPHITSE